MKEKTVLGLFELHWVTWCVDIKGVVYFDVIHDSLDLLELKGRGCLRSRLVHTIMFVFDT